MTGNELFDLRSRSVEQRLALTSRLAGADTQMALAAVDGIIHDGDNE